MDGLEYLEIWDRNAPLPMESNQTITWTDATKLVLDAYSVLTLGWQN